MPLNAGDCSDILANTSSAFSHSTASPVTYNNCANTSHKGSMSPPGVMACPANCTRPSQFVYVPSSSDHAATGNSALAADCQLALCAANTTEYSNALTS